MSTLIAVLNQVIAAYGLERKCTECKTKRYVTSTTQNDANAPPTRTRVNSSENSRLAALSPTGAPVTNRDDVNSFRKTFSASALGDALQPESPSDSFYSVENEMSEDFNHIEDDEFRAYLTRSVMTEQALLRDVEEAKAEVERLEAEWVQAASVEEKNLIKAKKWKADRHLDDCKRKLERFQSNTQLGELANQVSLVKNDVTEVKGRQDDLEKRQTELEKQVQEERAKRQCLEDTVAQLTANQTVLHQDQNRMRKTVDMIDADFMEAIDTVNEVGMPNDQGIRTSLLVRFVTVRDCQKLEEYMRSDEFREQHSDVSWNHDSSELQRVGKTRMHASGEALQQQFPGIELRATFVRFPAGTGVKHQATEFAASHIVINGTLFHIDDAVKSNPDYVPNPAAKVTFGGRTFSGQRLKNRGAGRSGRGRGRGQTRGGFGGNPSTGVNSGPPPESTATTPAVSIPASSNAVVAVVNTNPDVMAVRAAHVTRQTAPGQVTNHLPPINGPSAHQVELFANGGNYASNRPSNRIGGFPDRYVATASSRFNPYSVRH